MATKKKQYSNVLTGVKPKRKPTYETPAQRKERERLTRGLGDVELDAALDPYMNDLARLGLSIVREGISGTEDRRGITAHIPDKENLRYSGMSMYDTPAEKDYFGDDWPPDVKKYVSGLHKSPAVWYTTGYDKGVYDKKGPLDIKRGSDRLSKASKSKIKKEGFVQYGKHGKDLETLAHELGHIAEKYLEQMQDPMALRAGRGLQPPDRFGYEGDELLQRKIDTLRRKRINLPTSGVSRKIPEPRQGSKTEYLEISAGQEYPSKKFPKVSDLPYVKAASKELKRRRAAKRKRSNKNKTWNY